MVVKFVYFVSFNYFIDERVRSGTFGRRLNVWVDVAYVIIFSASFFIAVAAGKGLEAFTYS